MLAEYLEPYLEHPWPENVTALVPPAYLRPFHKRYEAWCEAHDTHPLNEDRFNRAVRELGHETERDDDGTYWVGLFPVPRTEVLAESAFDTWSVQDALEHPAPSIRPPAPVYAPPSFGAPTPGSWDDTVLRQRWEENVLRPWQQGHRDAADPALLDEWKKARSRRATT